MNTENYDLFFGGGYSIKEYYMESGNPRQMRGASELLSECVNEVENLLISKGVEKEHIIIGGANLSAMVPCGEGAKLVKRAEEIFRKKCRTANAAFVAVPFDASYLEVKKHALAEYESRRMAKFISWEFQDSEDEDIDSNDSNYQLIRTQEKPLNSKIPVRCPRCRLRTPRYEAKHNTEFKYLCTSCTKREIKSNNRKYDLRKECGENQFDYSYDINTVSDLADKEGHIALLYADINNLGGYRYKFSEFDEDKKFHDKVKESVEQAVSDAIRDALQLQNRDRKARFEIIALAGDDVCLLLPGNIALLTAKLIQQNFKLDGYPLTVSVAACVANDTTPITYMESIVADALDKAKQYSYKNNNQNVVCLSFFGKIGQLFPMTKPEMNIFSDLLNRTSDISITALRNVAEARREMKFDEEFSLYLDYYLSRDTIDHEKLLEEIRDKYKDKNPWSDFVTWRHQTL